MNPVAEEDVEETEDVEEYSPKQKEAIETAKELLSGGDLESGVFKELLMEAGAGWFMLRKIGLMKLMWRIGGRMSNK